MEWTEEKLKELQAQGKIRGYRVVGKQPTEKKGTKRHKYNARRTTVNGEDFDSEREATRYKELLLLQKAGEIGLIERQKEYELNEGGTHSLRYVADFVYRLQSTGEEVVEDCKGFRTKDYKKKRRLMKKVLGITIRET